jgi:DNA polymerase-3 subunit delta
MFDNQKQGWVQGQVRRRGGRISPEASELLLEMIENNTKELSIAIDRLVSFIGRDREITVDDIDAYLYHSKNENVFTLFDAMATRDFELSLEISRKILLSGESNPIQIVSGLLWQFRNLAAYARLLGQNYSASEACATLRVRSKRNQKTYAIGHKKFQESELHRAVSLLLDYELSIRTTRPALTNALVEYLVYQIVIERSGIRRRISA